MNWKQFGSPARWALAGLAIALASARVEAGQLTTFVLDVPNSIITATGTLSAGNTTLAIKSQVPGSLLATWSGTIEADVAAGVSIALTGGSSVLPVLQPGAFLPGPAPADLAGRVLNVLPGVNAYGAFRNDELDFTGPAMPLDGAGNFDAGPVITHFLSGQFDYSVDTFLNNSWSLIGGTLANAPGSLGQLTAVGPLFRLVLPIDSTISLSEAGFDLNLNVEGRIVAYARVPEPSSFVLALTGMVAFVGLRITRRAAVTRV